MCVPKIMILKYIFHFHKSTSTSTSPVYNVQVSQIFNLGRMIYIKENLFTTKYLSSSIIVFYSFIVRTDYEMRNLTCITHDDNMLTDSDDLG